MTEIKAEVDKGLALAETAELKAMGHYLLADIYSRLGERDKMAEALRLAESFKTGKEPR